MGIPSGYSTAFVTAWATPYCPGSSGPPTTYPDLPRAVEGLLGALVPNLVTWAGRGLAPPGQPVPYLAFGRVEERPEYEADGTDSPPYDDDGSFVVTCLAGTDVEADRLAGTVARALRDARPLLADGQVLYLRRTNRGSALLDPDPLPDGGDCWVAHLEFRTIVARNL